MIDRTNSIFFIVDWDSKGLNVQRRENKTTTKTENFDVISFLCFYLARDLKKKKKKKNQMRKEEENDAWKSGCGSGNSDQRIYL